MMKLKAKFRKNTLFLYFILLLIILPFYSNAQLVDNLDEGNIEYLASLYHFWSEIHDIDVQGDYAYLADFYSGLRIVDISDINQPVEVGQYNIQGNCALVIVQGDYAYITEQSNVGNCGEPIPPELQGQTGVHALNISDPANIEHLGFLPLTGIPQEMKIVSTALFITLNWAGMAIINITDPETIGYYTVYNNHVYTHIEAQDSLFYVASNQNSIKIFNYSNPYIPTRLLDLNIQTSVGELELIDDVLYALCDTDLIAFDASDPDTLVEISRLNYFGFMTHLEHDGNILYTVSEGSGMRIIDVSDPANMIQIGTYTNMGILYGIDLNASEIFIASLTQGFKAFDVSTPQSPTLITHHDQIGNIYDVQKYGDYLYIADRGHEIEYDEEQFAGGGLRIVDISDLENPVEVNFIDTPGTAFNLEIHNDYAYVMDREAGVSIYDLFVPDNPQLVGGTGVLNRAECITIDNSVAYVHNSDYHYGNSALFSFDISTPDDLELLDIIELPFINTESMAVYNSYLYAANWLGGICIVDISDPGDMNYLESFGDNWPVNLCVDGNYLFVVTTGTFVTSDRLNIYDISNPVNPSLIGDYQLSGTPFDIQVIGNRAYIANSYSGVHVFDISDLANPERLDYYNTDGSAQGIYVENGIAYTGDKSSIVILDVSGVVAVEENHEIIPPQTFFISNIYPNPFNPTTAITFYSPDNINARIFVSDILGREVSCLYNGRVAPGENKYIFDASNLSSGTYFIIADVNGHQSDIQKVTLLK